MVWSPASCLGICSFFNAICEADDITFWGKKLVFTRLVWAFVFAHSGFQSSEWDLKAQGIPSCRELEWDPQTLRHSLAVCLWDEMRWNLPFFFLLPFSFQLKLVTGRFVSTFTLRNWTLLGGLEVAPSTHHLPHKSTTIWLLSLILFRYGGPGGSYCRLLHYSQISDVSLLWFPPFSISPLGSHLSTPRPYLHPCLTLVLAHP